MNNEIQIRFGLRISQELWEKFRAKAKDNHRSLNAELVALIAKHVAK